MSLKALQKIIGKEQLKNKEMKKYVVALMLLAACQTSFAQSPESLYNYFKDEKGVESVHVSPLLMKLGRLFMDEEDKNSHTKTTAERPLQAAACRYGRQEPPDKGNIKRRQPSVH